jgi:hypothetical protein
MIVNRQTRQANRRALEKLRDQLSPGNSKRREDEVGCPAGARQ